MTDRTMAAPVESSPYPSEVTRAVGEATESGQLDLVALLREQAASALNQIESIEEALNPQIDANPEDRLLMEMLASLTDARDSLQDVADLLETMQTRDTSS